MTEQQTERVLAMRRKGASIHEIARKIGRSEWLVARKLVELGLHQPKPYMARPRKEKPAKTRAKPTAHKVTPRIAAIEQPAPASHPAIRAEEPFIRPPSLSQLMGGR